MAKITGISPKVDKNKKTGIPNKNKVEASDINEIVNVVNYNDDIKTEKGGYEGTSQDLKDAIDNAVFSSSITYQTQSDLLAVTPLPIEGTPAKVANDPTNSLNGDYSVSGGAWVINKSPVASISDSEDIKVDGNDLLLSNRDKTIETLGYKIIRSNFDFTNIPSGYDNSTWEVRHYHDLLTNSITLPENVTLLFNGGRISNGTITGDNTNVKANLEHIFSTDIVFLGSWNCLTCYPEWFGANGDGVLDDYTSINKAIDFINLRGGGDVVLKKIYSISDTIVIKSNVNLINEKTIVSGDTTPAVSFSNVSKSSFKGGEITSNGIDVTQVCFLVENSSENNIISDITITDFKNKGIDITTASNNNIISNLIVSGNTGTDGVGISIFGAGVDRPDNNTIKDCLVKNSRGGFAIQGGYYNKIINPVVEDCVLWGVGIDGVVSDSGDGGCYNIVDNPICKRVVNAVFGGIYLGNGSSNNIISKPILIDCSNGIRISGGVGYQPSENTFISPYINGNDNGSSTGVNGINLSNAPMTKIISPTIKNVSNRGIYLFVSPNSYVNGGEVYNCASEGVYLQTKECVIDNVYSHDNDYGIRIEFGGDANNTNRFNFCKTNSNTTFNIKNAINGTLFNHCLGYVNINSGYTTLLSGTNSIEVNHGLDYTPSSEDIVVTPSTNPSTLGAFWVAGITDTKFNINSNGTAGIDVSFAWRCEEIKL